MARTSRTAPPPRAAQTALTRRSSSPPPNPTLRVWSRLAIDDSPREWVALAPWMGLHLQPGATCRDPRTHLCLAPAFGVRIAAPAALGSRKSIGGGLVDRRGGIRGMRTDMTRGARLMNGLVAPGFEPVANEFAAMRAEARNYSARDADRTSGAVRFRRLDNCRTRAGCPSTSAMHEASRRASPRTDFGTRYRNGSDAPGSGHGPQLAAAHRLPQAVHECVSVTTERFQP